MFLFGELIQHNVFSHDQYLCTLVTRGIFSKKSIQKIEFLEGYFDREEGANYDEVNVLRNSRFVLLFSSVLKILVVFQLLDFRRVMTINLINSLMLLTFQKISIIKESRGKKRKRSDQLQPHNEDVSDYDLTTSFLDSDSDITNIMNATDTAQAGNIFHIQHC